MECQKATVRLSALLQLSVVTLLWLASDGNADIVSPGCNAERDFEHVYIDEGGSSRFHVRAVGHCQPDCRRDPHTPVQCPAGYYEKDFVNGCQNCSGGCRACDGDQPECVLHKLFPNQCRYVYENAEDPFLAVPDKRFYKIRHCERCHESCKECTGPLATDCTRCPATGAYWPVNKRCLKIRWRFTHGRRFQCFGADHCYIEHPSFEFAPLAECSAYEVKLYDDSRFCLECNNWYCEANCTYGMLTPECTFRDLGDGFHCKDREYRYLAVKARACIDRYDACSSSPCLDDYKCRSTLDWQGYACDCRNTTDGPICPRLVRPDSLMPNVFVNESSIDVSPSTSSPEETEGFTTIQGQTATPQRQTATPQRQTATPLLPSPQQATQGSDSRRIIAVSVSCTILVVIVLLVSYLIVRRYQRQGSQAREIPHSIARFLRRSESSISTASIPAPSQYKEMGDDTAAIISSRS